MKVSFSVNKPKFPVAQTEITETFKMTPITTEEEHKKMLPLTPVLKKKSFGDGVRNCMRSGLDGVLLVFLK